MINLFSHVFDAASSCRGKSFQKENKSNFSFSCFNNSNVTKESFPHQKRTSDLFALKLISLIFTSQS
jgi:hypothetical protein